jgi:hypothetical protein
MFGAVLRLVILLFVLGGLVVLFAYAFVTALIVAPIVLLLLFLFGRKPMAGLWVMTQNGRGPGRPSPHAPSQGPVIEHDPDDLPPRDQR